MDRLQYDIIYDSIQEARENDADELREKIIANKSVLDERIIKEKQVEKINPFIFIILQNIYSVPLYFYSIDAGFKNVF